ncbi:GRAM domain-containing protein [Paenibacillus segetis]|uniref:GRAM domain-containing protein n=1 Tax=Paenibacillus segetis TaxID=1325360 RepID=A0ABQ1YUW2_9BACL|nr:GRAM domain-containing protein [Paenibacillus segetis]GGH36943.1 hypothetical protein GCM10008013_44110 [Paenibacillus segetis]
MFILNDGEALLMSILAYYHKSGIEQVIGDLKVTNQRTIFESKQHYILQGHIEFLNKDIQTVEPFNSFILVPNGVKITLKSEQEYKFKLTDRERLIHILLKQKESSTT